MGPTWCVVGYKDNQVFCDFYYHGEKKRRIDIAIRQGIAILYLLIPCDCSFVEFKLLLVVFIHDELKKGRITRPVSAYLLLDLPSETVILGVSKVITIITRLSLQWFLVILHHQFSFYTRQTCRLNDAVTYSVNLTAANFNGGGRLCSAQGCHITFDSVIWKQLLGLCMALSVITLAPLVRSPMWGFC